MSVDFRSGVVHYLFFSLLMGLVCSIPSLVLKGLGSYITVAFYTMLLGIVLTAVVIETCNGIKYLRKKEQLLRYRYVWMVPTFFTIAYWTGMSS